MTKSERLFHLVLPDAWDPSSTRASGTLATASLATEGFVHLSFRGQLAGTLGTHFKAPKKALLLEIELPNATPELKLETSRDGDLFPHLYRPLRAGELKRLWHLEQNSSGWTLPQLGSRAEEDQPQGCEPFAVPGTR